MAVKVQVGMDEVVRHFEALEDPRSSTNQLPPLPSVVVISVMAVLAGAGGPTAIARWPNLKAEYLLKLLPLPNGIPQKDVYWRVLSALKPEAFQQCFTDWLMSLRARAAAATGIEQPVIAIDGKTDHRGPAGRGKTAEGRRETGLTGARGNSAESVLFFEYVQLYQYFDGVHHEYDH